MLPQAIRMLMEGSPPELNFDELVESVKQVTGVEDIHHLQVWELDEQHRSLEAHVVIATAESGQLEAVKKRIKECLADEWQIAHSTLEFEFPELSMKGAHDASKVADHLRQSQDA